MAKKQRKNTGNGEPAKMGRPRKFSTPAVVFTTSLPQSLVSEIDYQAEADGVKRADILRTIVQDWSTKRGERLARRGRRKGEG